ncbi:MAG: hypothetical protein NC177_16360 [Ruminococcus flavefaciens]|nr:hypothetical protein [Ruminococcus flavefaciens]
MKVTYSKILSAKESLGKLLDKPLPMKEAVSLARLIKKLNDELEVFNDKQKELFERYGRPDAELGKYVIDKENQLVFSSQFEDLVNVEFDIDSEKVCIESDIEIEASVVMATDDFIVFKTE